MSKSRGHWSIYDVQRRINVRLGFKVQIWLKRGYLKSQTGPLLTIYDMQQRWHICLRLVWLMSEAWGSQRTVFSIYRFPMCNKRINLRLVSQVWFGLKLENLENPSGQFPLCNKGESTWRLNLPGYLRCGLLVSLRNIKIDAVLYGREYNISREDNSRKPENHSRSADYLCT